MTYTKAGRILAVLAISLGVLRILTAILVLMSDDPVGAARAILGSKTTGQAIDQGLYAIVFGILVGILTDMSKSLLLVSDTQRDTDQITKPDPSP